MSTETVETAPALVVVSETSTPPEKVEKVTKMKTKKAAKKIEKKVAKKAAPKTAVVKRKTGPWMKHFKPGVDMSKQGVCKVKKCTKKVGKAKWCAAHKKEIRTLQLKLNNVTWHKAVDEGDAGHHVVYTVEGVTRATEWARLNPSKAVALANKHGTVDPATLKKLIAQSEKDYEKEVKARAKEVKQRVDAKIEKKRPTKKAA